MIANARSRSLNVVEHRGQRAEVLRERAVPDQVADDAEDLGEHDADDLRPRRYVDPGQLLDGEAVREVVHHAAEVVDAIGVGHERVPRLALGHLLGAAVVKADVGHGIDDALAVELQDDPQDAVRAGVLRTDVEEQEVGAVGLSLEAPVLGPEAQRLLLLLFAIVRELEDAHLGGAGGMLLAQRMALPRRRHEDAPQRAVTLEAHAEHVPGLALVPARRRPEVGGGRQRGSFTDERDLDPDVGVSFERQQVVDDGEVARRLLGAVPPLALVDRGQVVEHAVRPLDALLEVTQHASHLVGAYPERRNLIASWLRRRRDVQPGAKFVDERGLRERLHLIPRRGHAARRGAGARLA